MITTTTYYCTNIHSSELQAWVISKVPEVIHITCNTGAHDLSDMYVLSPWAHGPWALGIHVRHILHSHVKNITWTPSCTSQTPYSKENRPQALQQYKTSGPNPLSYNSMSRSVRLVISECYIK